MDTQSKIAVDHAIEQATQQPFRSKHLREVGGGCINRGYIIGDGERRFFVKLNRAELGHMFEAEAAGLAEIQASGSIRAPQPIACGTADRNAYLVLEFLALEGSAVDDDRLGRDLAAMHRVASETYGWHQDNTIGSTPQINPRSSDWVVFWRDQRLGYQLSLAAKHGHTGALQRKGDQLLGQLDQLLSGHRPAASLLHGDLWSGNYSGLADGTPVIFDPAVYFGDRETDLAMTELFGGFSPRFYAAYREAYPLEAGYNMRRTLYNLYHVLNHLNLFGGGYKAQAEDMMDRLLSESKP